MPVSLLQHCLQAFLAAIDTGAHLTKTAAAGTKTTKIKEQDARFFSDGFGMIKGDAVMIGKSTARILAVDIASNTITLDKALTFKAGDNVDLPYSGKAPDLGAFELNPPVVK
jgi:predicted phage tail protein